MASEKLVLVLCMFYCAGLYVVGATLLSKGSYCPGACVPVHACLGAVRGVNHRLPGHCFFLGEEEYVCCQEIPLSHKRKYNSRRILSNTRVRFSQERMTSTNGKEQFTTNVSSPNSRTRCHNEIGVIYQKTTTKQMNNPPIPLIHKYEYMPHNYQRILKPSLSNVQAPHQEPVSLRPIISPKRSFKQTAKYEDMKNIMLKPVRTQSVNELHVLPQPPNQQVPPQTPKSPVPPQTPNPPVPLQTPKPTVPPQTPKPPVPPLTPKPPVPPQTPKPPVPPQTPKPPAPPQTPKPPAPPQTPKPLVPPQTPKPHVPLQTPKPPVPPLTPKPPVPPQTPKPPAPPQTPKPPVPPQTPKPPVPPQTPKPPVPHQTPKPHVPPQTPKPPVPPLTPKPPVPPAPPQTPKPPVPPAPPQTPKPPVPPAPPQTPKPPVPPAPPQTPKPPVPPAPPQTPKPPVPPVPPQTPKPPVPPAPPQTPKPPVPPAPPQTPKPPVSPQTSTPPVLPQPPKPEPPQPPQPPAIPPTPKQPEISRSQKACERYRSLELNLSRSKRNSQPNDFHIVCGVHACIREVPFMVAVGYTERAKTKEVSKINWGCGGSLISERYVLTAAHCLPEDNKTETIPTRLRMGESYLSNVPGSDDYLITGIVPHPRFSTNSHYYDLALLRTDRPVVFSRVVFPICLPKSNDTLSMQVNAPLLLTAGWGATDIEGSNMSNELRKTELAEVPLEECKKLRPPTFRTPKGILPHMLCARDPKRRSDTCSGDSGGPLVSRTRGGDRSLIAVTSYGVGPCAGNTPGVYTRTASEIAWIESVVWP